jgi:hypothetical protein
MGYRSCVAMAVYGTPQKVDMVDALLLQKLHPEYDRDMFERVKQVCNYEDGERCILWTFDDIKWYSDLDIYKDDVFSWVDSMVDEEANHERDWTLAVDFVRIGEENTDVEEQFSELTDYRLSISRRIELPTNFEWRT